MAKLQLNDAAFAYQAETSAALGFGFRCGFLGLLHMEIIQERLRREYNMDIIATYPSVIYHVYLTDGEMLEIDNPVNLPDPSVIDRIEEPMIEAHIMAPSNYIGDIMNLILQKRGVCTKTESVDANHVLLTAEMPMHEILIDFHDRLKSITRGYGSMDYEMNGYRAAKLVKLDILVNGEPVDAFSTIVHTDHAYEQGRELAERLSGVIPQHQFQVAVQAAIGGKVIARETVKAYRKNVLAKCYGGDITRKKKLLEKQKEGKKRMRKVGSVDVPSEVVHQFLGAYIVKTVLGLENEDVINAVKYHTTGRANMSNLEKLTFIADLIEPTRSFTGVEELQRAVFNDFESGFKLSVSELYKFLLKKQSPVYYLTGECYNYYVKGDLL